LGMSQFQTRVHIAGPIVGNVQRCARCGTVLIDSTGAMSVDGMGMSYWTDGGYVGIVEACDDSRLNPVCSIAMDRDAFESDELTCGGNKT